MEGNKRHRMKERMVGSRVWEEKKLQSGLIKLALVPRRKSSFVLVGTMS